MAASNRPVFVVLAGPNGAGKSTTAARVMVGEFVNPDVVAKRINPGYPEGMLAALQAGREVIGQLKDLKANGRSFTYETTLSSNDSLRQIRDAKAKGYEVRLYFVALADVDTSIDRVGYRVLRGGHNIPTEALQRRFPLILANVLEVAPRVDRFELIDNQDWEGKSRLLIENGRVVYRHRSDYPGIEALIGRIVASCTQMEAP
jgi:predicted ABC-type ATPase